jgi:hypothetical protein
LSEILPRTGADAQKVRIGDVSSIVSCNLTQ